MTPEVPGSETRTRGDVDAPRAVSGAVDWIVSVLLVLVGIALVLVGFALRELLTRATVADWVAEGTVESDVFSEADLVEVTVSLGQWSGLGLVLTGALLALGGVVFLLYRRRERRRGGGEAAGSFGTSAVYGAVVAVATSFVPASTVIGGAVAAYLQREGSGAKVGAVSGLISAVPVLLLGGFLVVGVVDGLTAVGESAGAFFVAGAGVVALAVLLLFVVVLGAVGGVVGSYLVDRSRRRSRPTDRLSE